MSEQLEQLYQQAKSALKARDYDRASNLLRQILLIDENYKDTSRLLAQSVKLKRRRWYNDPRSWGAIGFMIVLVLGLIIVPRMRGLCAIQPSAPVVANSSTAMLPLTIPSTITATVLPSPTPIPFAWKRISIGQEFPRDKIIAFEIDPKDSDVLYVHMEHAGYFKSIDGGISWGPVQRVELKSEFQQLLKDLTETGDFSVENTASDGKERVYRLDSTRWLVSEDSGQSWHEFSATGYPISHTIAFDQVGNLYIYRQTNLLKFSPDGRNKTTLGNPDIGQVATILTISASDPNTIYAAGEGFAVSKDGGLTWTKLNNGLGSTLLHLEAGEEDHGALYVSSRECLGIRIPLRVPEAGSSTLHEISQSLFRSTDGGKTWNLASQTGCYLIKDADGKTIYRVGGSPGGVSSGWIWRSTDGGRSWEQVLTPNEVLTLVTDQKQSGLLYIYLGNGDVWTKRHYVSEDYGHTWKVKDPPASIKPCYGSTLQFIDTYRPMAIDPSDGNHVLFIDDGLLQESCDSCESWNVIEEQPPYPLNGVAIDPNNPKTIYVSADSGAYVSFDSGASWHQVNDGLLGATVVYSIVVNKESTVHAATPYGIFKLENK